LTTVLAAAGSSVRKSKALPVPRRSKDFKEQYEVLKKKRMFRVQLYGSTSVRAKKLRKEVESNLIPPDFVVDGN
jgi:hypothetical protein